MKGKGIVHIEISHQGTLLAVIEKAGTVHVFHTEAQRVIHSFQDSSGGRKWNCACFDHEDQHIIFSSNQLATCTLMVFSLKETGFGLLTSDLQGPSEAVQQIIFHPLWPHIYTRGTSGLRIWTPTYLNSWTKLVPGFDEVLANDLYQEKESEFDEEEAVDEFAPVLLSEPIDVFTIVPEFLFASDEQYPDQLLYLPLDIKQAIGQRSESIEKVLPLLTK